MQPATFPEGICSPWPENQQGLQVFFDEISNQYSLLKSIVTVQCANFTGQ